MPDFLKSAFVLYFGFRCCHDEITLPQKARIVFILRAGPLYGQVLHASTAQPERLDLYDSFCRLAKAVGVKLAISTDAHGVEEFDFMRYGIDQARRGWLESVDVLDTRPLAEPKKLLRPR